MITQSTKIKDKSKKVIFRNRGLITIVEVDGKMVDMLFGDCFQAKQDLEAQGFKVEIKTK